jgi:hypothetical protein
MMRFPWPGISRYLPCLILSSNRTRENVPPSPGCIHCIHLSPSMHRTRHFLRSPASVYFLMQSPFDFSFSAPAFIAVPCISARLQLAKAPTAMQWPDALIPWFHCMQSYKLNRLTSPYSEPGTPVTRFVVFSLHGCNPPSTGQLILVHACMGSPPNNLHALTSFAPFCLVLRRPAKLIISASIFFDSSAAHHDRCASISLDH